MAEDDQRRITGKIIDSGTGRGLSGLRVELYDHDAKYSDYLGSATTDAQGRFAVEFDAESFKDSPQERGPDVVAKVYDGERLILTTQDAPIKNWTPDRNPLVLKVDYGEEPADPDESDETDDGAHHSVEGEVVDPRGRPLPGSPVRAFDRALCDWRLLGEAATNDQGRYRITYAQETLAAWGKERADLKVEVYDRATGDEVLAASPLILQARPLEVLDFSIGGDYVGPDEHSRVREVLEPLLRPVEDLACLEVADVLILAREGGQASTNVALYIKARRWSGELEIDPAVLYGLLRQGLPTSLDALLARPLSRLWEGLEEAKRLNIVDVPLGEAQKASLASLQQRYLMRPDQPYSRLLDTAGLDDAGKSTFTTHLASGTLDGEALWLTLEQDEGFGAEQIESLQQTFELLTLTDNSTLVVRLRADRGIDHPRETAAYTLGDWSQALSAEGVQVPDFVLPGAADALRRDAYAQSLYRAAEARFPTASLTAQMGREPAWSGHPTCRWLLANPELELDDQRMTRYLAEHGDSVAAFSDPDALTRDLLRLEQLFHLTAPATDRLTLIEPLWDAGLASATQIALAGRDALIRKIGDQVQRETIDRIHARAAHQNAFALNLYMRFNPQAFGASMTAVQTLPFGGSTNPQGIGPGAAEAAEWEALFGSPDACDCQHCESSIGQAAYLVDMLVFLSRANDANDRNAQEIFLERRPDIGLLELGCDNTYTTLPQIDLFIESAEQIIANSSDGVSIPAVGFNTTWEPELLEALQEHQEPAAYALLRQASYPFSLPFDLWLEEGRRCLAQMGVPRAELMRRMPRQPGVDAAAIAAESLGLSAAESEVITSARVRDGVLATYWGIHPGLGTPVSQLAPVETFLRQARIDYDRLLRLLNTRFLNPGRAIEVTFTGDPCALDGAELNGGNLALLLDRGHRLLRLQRRLEGWSEYDIDLVIRALGVSDFDDPSFLPALAEVEALQARYGLPIAELTSWWAGLDTYAFEEDGESHYEAIFLDPALFPDMTVGSGPDLRNEVFGLTPDRSDLVVTQSSGPSPSRWLAEAGAAGPILTLHEEYASYIQGATGLTAEDLALLVDALLPKDPTLGHVALNLLNLSLLYRIASFTRALEISVSDLLKLQRLIGQAPLTAPSGPASPLDTRRFIDAWETIDAGAWTVEELDYLLLHGADAAAALGPDSIEVEELLQALGAGFEGASEGSVQDQVAAARADEQTPALIAQALSTALELNAEVVEALLFEVRPDLGDAALWHLIAVANPALPSGSGPPLGFESLFERLLKFALAWRHLAVTSDHLAFVLTEGPGIGWTDIAAFPLTEQSGAALSRWHRLVQAAELQNTVFTEEQSLFSLLAEPFTAQPAPSREAYLAQAAEWTGWALADLTDLLGPNGFDARYPDDFRGERWLSEIERILAMIRPLGTTASQARAWTRASLDYADTQAIKQSLAVAYERDTWLEVMAAIQDDLRRLRRDALLDQLLGRWPREDVDFIHAHYFIDPAMEPCARTSRMAQAHAAVQLFAQRILLNLEPSLSFPRGDAEAWTWRKRYRVWQAAREVFLYPQNWALPEVRDNKSVFFEELEDGLRQDEVTTENVERLYREYLYKLDAVSRLEIMGLYQDESTDTLHVFGRTRHDPRRYFYRRREDGARWTPWEAIELDIQSDHLVPIVYNGRLNLFWAEFAVAEIVPDTAELDKEIDQLAQNIADARIIVEERAELFQGLNEEDPVLVYIEDTLEPEKTAKETARDTIIADTPAYHVDIRMSWSLYAEGQWHPRKTSASAAASYDTDFLADQHFFTGWVDKDNRLLLAVEARKLGQIIFDWIEEKEYIGHFLFRDCQDGLQFDPAEIALPQGPGSMLYASHELNALKLEAYYLELEFADPLSQRRLLDQLPAATNRLHYAHQYGVATQETVPFFHADDHRSYFVQPIGVLTANAYENIPVARDTGIRSLSSFSLNEPSTQLADIATHYQGVASQAVIDRTVSDQVSLFSEDDYDRLSALQSGAQPWDPIPHQGSVISSETRYRFTRHYHPCVCLFLKQLSRHGIDGLLDPDPSVGEDSENLYRQLLPFSDFDFAALYAPTEWVRWDGSTDEEIDFEHHSAYGGYNWELFFHIPLLIAERLRAEQRFEESRRWYHFIFDPTKSDDPQDGTTERYWKIRPFYEHALGGSTASLSELIALAQQGDLGLERQVKEWEADPFQPHAVARMRIVAYMMYTVQGYLDLLIQWGDMLFAQDQREQVEEAKQLYLLAADILGDRPTLLPAQDAPTLTTSDLLGLGGSGAELGLGVLERINQLFATWLPGIPFPKASPPAGAEGVAAASGGGTVYDTLLLFCTPPNTRLLGLWDKVADRLFKVRNCMNLDGQVRALALYAPPIDPGLLIKAAAAGLSIDSVVNSLYASLPHYRFTHVLQKALEICGEVRTLGTSVLSALEKRDGEELAVLRSGHETQMLTSLRQLKEHQIDEAKAAIQALTDSKRLPEKRLTHYRGLLSNGLNSYELEQQKQLVKANILQIVSQGTSLLGSLAFMVSAFIKKGQLKEADYWSGIGHSIQAVTTGLGAIATHHTYKASKASLAGSYERRQDDWQLQQALAARELQQIDKQLVTAEIRLQMAEEDLQNHDEQTARAQAADEFLRAKFTGQALYGWMLSELATLYFQAYDRAYQLALQAQQTFQRELGPDESNAIFVVAPYWDGLKEGLLAGERLHDTLRQMERAHMDANRRELEITKTISLFQLDPQALLDLRATGDCSFHVPEVLFDLDFAGHFFRRIKSVRVTMPGVVGPATNLSATLTLTRSWVRTAAVDPASEPEEVVTTAPQVSIATSSGNNDSGLFELRFADSRYLPFEGCGVISSWNLALPSAFRAFPYDSISDVLLHISYTARDGVLSFKEDVNQRLLSQLNDLKVLLGENGITLSRLVSLRRELPTEWSRLLNPADGQDQAVTLTIDKSLFPSYLDFYWDAGVTAKEIILNIERAMLYLQRSPDAPKSTVPIRINGQEIIGDDASSLDFADLTGEISGALGHNDSIDATLTVDQGELIPGDWNDIYLLLEYRVDVPSLAP